MKVLIIHNRYKFEGGEETVVSAEADLLKKNDHEVLIFELSNEGLAKCNFIKKILLPFRIIWSISSYKEVRSIIKREKPDIVHVHNTFFLMSPSVYYACRDENIPVVQTLHNYRFLCPLGTLYRDGRVCRECLDKGLMMSIKYKCGRKSKLWTLAMLWILRFHHKNNTFKRFIDTYIALSNFSRQQFIQAGFEGQKIKVKPNFINFDPGFSSERKNFALYVGRFSPEKGIDILLEAWRKNDYLPLKIIGTGIQFEEFKDYTQKHSLNVEFLGQRPNSDVINYIKKSLIVVLPSRCNENFPRTLVECFACGAPVVASKRGALAEIIEDGKSGLLFEPEKPDDLVEKIDFVCKNREIIETMSKNARKEYEEKYTAEKNYEILMNIYRETIEHYNA